MKWYVLIPIASLIVLFGLYILVGFIGAKKINFVRKRTYAELYRREFNQNVPHELIDPKCQRIYLKSRLGYDMAARFYPSENKSSHKYLLMLHGYNNASQTCGKYALTLFNPRGIHCLAPDSRYLGESGGKGITFGYFERADAEQWIEEIYKMDQHAEIGIFGISLGGAVSILTASVRADIKYIIPYCSYSSYRDIMMDVGKRMMGNLIKFVYPAIVIGGYLTTGARQDMVDVAAALKNVTCPVLIMHSKDDDFTPFRHALRLHQAKPEADFKSFEGPRHARAYTEQPQIYTEYVNEFLDKISI